MQKLNTTLVYILSVVGFICCCFGIGWIPSLIAYVIANKETKKYQLNPENYSNGPSIKSAKIVALIALIISALVGLYAIYIVIMISTNPEFACEFWTEALQGAEESPYSNPEGIEFYRQMQEDACSKI